MNAAQEDACQRGVAGSDAAHEKWLRMLLGFALAAAFALPGTSVLAQSSPIMPKFSIGGEKKVLTPEEAERQKQIDADYKVANSKIPTQKAPDSLGRCAPGACWLGTEGFRFHEKRIGTEEEAIGATTAIASSRFAAMPFNYPLCG